jgi:transposase
VDVLPLGSTLVEPIASRFHLRGGEEMPTADTTKSRRGWRFPPTSATDVNPFFDPKLDTNSDEERGKDAQAEANSITEGFRNKMELIKRQTYGFRNFENYRLRVKVLCVNQFGFWVCPSCWRRAA